ncbi:branched-chain amino acid ABC transporter permease [Halomarina halobia]|uniref:Branched-chain amino acid ABC transporter permease n=1 Tax=Halomarina halobia TaxID=3033386 RepID=A0ABD6AFZ5_9EURY|nr:branched-chain amino acid ABC transporter permease [Halomarina sp. PSR21]
MNVLSFFPLFVTPLLDGLSWGVMLVLIAMGLTLIFGFLEVVNFAHGGFYMLGGYMVFAVISAGYGFFAGVAGAIVIVAILGILTERLLLRRSYDFGPITQLLIMVGLALAIEGAVIYIWGEQAKGVAIPNMLSGSVLVFGSTYPIYRLALVAIGSVLIIGVWLFLERSRIGLVIRASLTDKEMARAFGNDIPTIYTYVFASGVVIAAFAGALMTPIRGIGPGTGASILLQAFIVVVVGGLGSYRGSVVAGLGLGMIDVLVARYISFRLSGITIIAVLLVVLLLQPRGLFGVKGVMEE